MATVVKEKPIETLGFGVSIVIAGLVGLIGGLLLGVWDSIAVIIDHSRPPVALAEMLPFALYSASLYGAIGCLVMVVIGLATAGVARVGGYSVSKSRLAGIFSGLFVFMILSALLSLRILDGNVFGIVMNTMFSAVVGLAVGFVSAYLLAKIIRKDKLIAVCISLLAAIPVLLYGFLWSHVGFLSRGALWKQLLADASLFLVVGSLAVGLYRLSLFVLRRCSARTAKQVSLLLLAVVASAVIAVSVIGPFDV